MFRKPRPDRKSALTGAPAVRRVKTYAAASGYVYEHVYEGRREEHSSGSHATEFVFGICSNRNEWRHTSVLLGEDAVRAWEHAHGRELSETERYAIAKLALFQAMDERAHPLAMREEVRVREADLEAIVEKLGL